MEGITKKRFVAAIVCNDFRHRVLSFFGSLEIRFLFFGIEKSFANEAIFGVVKNLSS